MSQDFAGQLTGVGRADLIKLIHEQNENLTSVQTRCTELLLLMRSLNARIEELEREIAAQKIARS